MKIKGGYERLKFSLEGDILAHDVRRATRARFRYSRLKLRNALKN